MPATKANGTLMARRGLGHDHCLMFSQVELGGLEPRPPACKQVAAGPPASIAAAHRPGTCARVRSDPGALLYFPAVLTGMFPRQFRDVCDTACRVSRFPPSATRRGRPEVACHGFDLTLLPMTACSLSACSCPAPDTHAYDHDQRRSASQAVSLVLTGWARAAQIILFWRLVPIAESHAGRFTVSEIERF
jgi:hypothetical protein